MSFGGALGVMLQVYASVTGTAVIQVKHVPPIAEHYKGSVMLFGVRTDLGVVDVRSGIADQCKAMPRICELRADQSPPGYARWHLVLESHEAAEAAVKAMGAPIAERHVDWMKEEQFFADLEWNGRSYDDIKADGGRGWCVTEQGVALAVESHLTSSKRVTRFRTAIAARPKVTLLVANEHGGYISAQPVKPTNEAGELMAPEDQLRKTKDDIEHAKFTGKVGWHLTSPSPQTTLLRSRSPPLPHSRLNTPCGRRPTARGCVAS